MRRKRTSTPARNWTWSSPVGAVVEDARAEPDVELLLAVAVRAFERPPRAGVGEGAAHLRLGECAIRRHEHRRAHGLGRDIGRDAERHHPDAGPPYAFASPWTDLCHDADGVRHHLEKTARDPEPFRLALSRDGEEALAERRHEGRVPRKDAHLAVVDRHDDRVGLAVKHRRLGRDHEHTHQAAAIFAAFVDHVFDAADHVEGLLRQVIEFTRRAPARSWRWFPPA